MKFKISTRHPINDIMRNRCKQQSHENRKIALRALRSKFAKKLINNATFTKKAYLENNKDVVLNPKKNTLVNALFSASCSVPANLNVRHLKRPARALATDALTR